MPRQPRAAVVPFTPAEDDVFLATLAGLPPADLSVLLAWALLHRRVDRAAFLARARRRGPPAGPAGQ
jgi:hypothetical protein